MTSAGMRLSNGCGLALLGFKAGVTLNIYYGKLKSFFVKTLGVNT